MQMAGGYSADTVIPLPADHILSLDAENNIYTEDIDVNMYNEGEAQGIAGLGGNKDSFPHLRMEAQENSGSLTQLEETSL